MEDWALILLFISAMFTLMFPVFIGLPSEDELKRKEEMMLRSYLNKKEMEAPEGEEPLTLDDIEVERKIRSTPTYSYKDDTSYDF